MKQYIDSRTGNTFSIIMAMFIAVGILWYQNYSAEQRREERFAALRAERVAKEAAPATDWFAVRNISIPDFVEGSDPVIVYDRVIKLEFTATWIVEVHGVTSKTNFSVCSGSGTRVYKPGEATPDPPTLKWFIDRECGLKEGQYVAEVSWEIRPLGYPVKPYSATSNIFRVLPKGSQLYLGPEQVKQLEKAQELLDNPKIIEKLEGPEVP